MSGYNLEVVRILNELLSIKKELLYMDRVLNTDNGVNDLWQAKVVYGFAVSTLIGFTMFPLFLLASLCFLILLAYVLFIEGYRNNYEIDEFGKKIEWKELAKMRCDWIDRTEEYQKIIKKFTKHELRQAISIVEEKTEYSSLKNDLNLSLYYRRNESDEYTIKA